MKTAVYRIVLTFSALAAFWFSGSSAFAGTWTYSNDLITHSETAWILAVSKGSGTVLTVTGVATAPSVASALPLADPVSGYQITSIGSSAFYYCTGLTGVSIPGSVTSIGESAFSGCTRLKSVTIPGSVTSIEDFAFSDCTGLTSAIIGNGVTSIAYGAFYGCTGLTNVTIPGSVTNIGEWAFSGCVGLASITVSVSNMSYSSADGVLFDKGKTMLMQYPCRKTGSYAIPGSVASIEDEAFYGCAGLTGVTIPSSVTSIGYSAFYGCTGLTNFTVSASNMAYSSADGVLFDKGKTFLMQYPCGKNGSYAIPSSVTNFGFAFSGCAGLTGVTIPGSVISIGEWAFSDCTGLTNAVIGNGVTGIAYGAFYGCTGLTNVMIPGSVTSIGYSAFSGCTGLTGVTIPGSVTNIGDSAFSGCTGLMGVTIPSGVTSIAYGAFYGCTGLTSVTIPGSVTSIGDSAFSGCTSLTDVTIPGGVTSIAYGAFDGCTGLTSFTVNASNVSYSSAEGVLFDKGKRFLMQYPCGKTGSYVIPGSVISIKGEAFSSCTGLTGITIPGSVSSIGYYVFFGCTGLTGVTIPNSVTDIGYGAFSGCTGLTGVTIPNSVTNIGNRAFSHCTGMTNAVIGNSVVSIKDEVFSGCTGLTGVTIPGSVTSIGDWAFSGCTGLTSAVIGSGVTSIGNRAFSGCTALTNFAVSASNMSYSSVDGVLFDKGQTMLIAFPGGKVGRYAVPGNVTSIGYNAFSGCARLTDVTISGSVTSIGDWAFSGCTGLTNAVIGNGVTGIGYGAFSGCTGLTNFAVSASNISYSSVDGILFDKSQTMLIAFPGGKVGSYVIPDCVVNIRDTAFSGCAGLTDVTIPDSVTSIGEWAFLDCTSLTNVVIGNGVTGIGYGAFSGCTGLKGICFKGNAPSADWLFDETSGSIVYYLPGTTGWTTTFGGRPTAVWNQFPLITKLFPASNPGPVNEGASVSFSVTASDSTDGDVTRRGMSNIVWNVDGIRKQETRTGAPNAIASGFTFKPDTATVQGMSFRDVEVKAVATDRQGGATGAVWTVRVNNMPVSQTITFAALPVKALGDPDLAPGARASSGLSLEYTSSNIEVAKIVDGLVNIVGAGTAVITANQPGNFDFKAATPMKQILTVKARLSATISDGGGTVTGTGLYLPGTKVALTAKPATGNTFLCWEDGSQLTARSLVMPNANLSVSAWFGATTNVPQPVVANPGTQRVMVGLPFQLPLDVTSESLPTITVAGLPTGLSFRSSTKTIAGVPTASVTNRTVTVTAKNVNKTAATETFTMTVDPLPAWAQGNFNGWFGGVADNGPIWGDVTAQGKVSGKFSSLGTNYTFSAASYARRDGDGAFWVTATASVVKVSMPLTLAVRCPAGVEPAGLSVAEGWFGVAADGDAVARLYRNVWRDAGMVAFLTNTYVGYYTATLPGGAEYGSGYLTFTVDKTGGVKTVGKLADGTAVSLSGTLVLDEAGRVFAVLYTSPTAYKGGSLFGLAEFCKVAEGLPVTVRPLEMPFVWTSLNPLATGEYGAFFTRTPVLSGGWYDTLGNLYRYYAGQTLSVGTDAGAPVPELLVGTNRYDSIWWSPNGLTVSAVTNGLGVLTGLAAPRVGAPLKSGTNYVYATATNAVGLTVSLKRATGVFTGSFKAWFDYSAAHASRTVALEGVLTPERDDREDGVEGRGFFLWQDTARYANPAGKPVTYGFSWSYDLLLLGL